MDAIGGKDRQKTTSPSMTLAHQDDRGNERFAKQVNTPIRAAWRVPHVPEVSGDVQYGGLEAIPGAMRYGDGQRPVCERGSGRWNAGGRRAARCTGRSGRGRGRP